MKHLLVTLATLFTLSAPQARAAEIDVFDAARQGNIDYLTHYVMKGGDVETRNHRGHTPFILATYYGQTETAKQLRDIGAEPCALDMLIIRIMRAKPLLCSPHYLTVKRLRRL